MIELLKDYPWLLPAALVFLIPIFGIVFGTTTNYLARVRQAELETSLKREMLQRGMSAEEIRIIIEATPRRKGKACGGESYHRQEVS
jgi:hypothetical protein